MPPIEPIVRWYECDAESTSLGWEAAHGFDSIPTIERVYSRTSGGAYECCWPGGRSLRPWAVCMCRHIFSASRRTNSQPDNFDPGPWL